MEQASKSLDAVLDVLAGVKVRIPIDVDWG